MDIREEVRIIANRYMQKVRSSGPDDVMAICPFHRKLDGSEEKRPSFAMSLSKGLYFCHACQAKGNLFTFLRDVGNTREQIEHGFRRLIDAVARNLPPAPDPLDPKVVTYDPIPEGLLGLFDYCPSSLLSAGFTEETLQSFEVGWDRWYNRITFPLRDMHGQLVGISGRNETDDWPKYKIYDKEYETWDLPARSLWNKRTVLWNAHRVYPSIYFNPEGGDVIVVEGFKAAMWVWQAGIKDVVALLGAYLTWEQKWILERMGSRVYLFLDNDEWGIKGTVKAANFLQPCGIPVFVLEYPSWIQDHEDSEKAQPDWLTANEVLEAKATAKPFVSWLAT